MRFGKSTKGHCASLWLWALLMNTFLPRGDVTALPTINTPDPQISEVFRGNWENTLKPCQIQCGDSSKRPWRVDVGNRYPDWYCGIDVKYQTRAYLFCEKNLPLVLTGWQHTLLNCRLPNGGIQSTEINGNPGTAYAFRSKDGTTITYALRTSGTIDLLLIGDMIFCFSQDQLWLKDNIQYMRGAAHWLEGWIDDQGMLYSDDYDHDSLMRRGTDGTAQASACMAFRKLAALEDVLGNSASRDHFETVANRLARAAKQHLWDPKTGYFFEFAEVNNVAKSTRLGFIGGASSELGPNNASSKAIDGILGYGLDAAHVGEAAGQSEWAAKDETIGAWIQVNLKAPTAINRVILYNRQAPEVRPCETFATGHLDFSDGSAVHVKFDPGPGSRAVAAFESRTVSWVKFTGDKMQGEGRGSAGVAEFEITPTAEPYLKFAHGMSDVNFALLGYRVADEAQAASVWKYFKAHEDAFYTYNGVSCPTWTTERPELYTERDLNSINPNKDRTAFGRIWRHDVWMRKRMGDGEGIYKTIQYANDIYRRPSGGGPGFFGERYDLGKFTPGDDAQDSTPKYAEYPAEYNATVVGEVLLGISADVRGTIVIDPCVPIAWYRLGFGIENPGVLKDRDIGYVFRSDSLTGWVRGKTGRQTVRSLLPPDVTTVRVIQDGKDLPHKEFGRYTSFTLKLVGGRTHKFVVQGVARR
jgi:hypothetical protein